MSDMFKPVETTLPVEKDFWTSCEAWLSQDAEEFLDRIWKKICNFFFPENEVEAND